MANPPDYSRACFVMMPYGLKPVADRRVNFDRIYDAILDPAIRRVKTNGKSMIPLRADRRLDARSLIFSMKQDLLRARLVLAELSAENTNVGLELGMRYFAVPCGTVLVHLKGTPIPFDLAQQFVLPYANRPTAEVERSIGQIAASLRATLASCKPDNPGYQAAHRLADQMGDPMNPTPLGDRIVDAESALMAGDPEKAVRAYAEAVILEPQNTTLYQIYGLSLIRTGQTADAEKQFRTVLQLNPELTDARRILGDLRAGQMPRLIDRSPLGSPAINSLGIGNLNEAMRTTNETYVKVVPESRPEGLMSHVAVIGGPAVNRGQIFSAVTGLGLVKEYPAMYYPESNRTVWSFDVQVPHATSAGSAVGDLKNLKQSLSVLPGPKKIDFGGGSSGGGSFGGGGMGGMF